MENKSEQKKVLVRKYHTMCRRLGLDEETRKAMLAQYDVESSKDLSIAELTKLIIALGAELHNTPENKARKRVIGAAIGYLEANKEGFATWAQYAKVEYAKGAAVKASGMATAGADIDELFDRIPIETLVKISAMFNKMKKLTNKN